jgi:hypothetical protein
MRFQTHTTPSKLVGTGFGHAAAAVAYFQERKRMRSRVELVHCIMVVATAVLSGIIKSTASAVCSRCSCMVEPFD